jgi:ABC-2 type transport system ATP-binding protein
VVVVEELERGFGGRVVLDRISFQIPPGGRVALRGPNGSGKSTLLRCVLGTLLPDSGSVRVAGEPAGSIAARRATGASLSQERSFYLRLSGRENLLFFARLRGFSRRDASNAVQELLSELALVEIAEQRGDRCSTGQLQQLSLARTFLGEPPVLLLDEPTRSLDEDARGRLWAALDRRPDAAVLFATHLDSDAARATGVIELKAHAGETP